MSYRIGRRWCRDYPNSAHNPRDSGNQSLPFSAPSMGISVFNGSTLKFLMVDKVVSANYFAKRALMNLARLSPL